MIHQPPEWRRRLTTVGITGTNGKTSTTLWTAACLARLARPVAQTTTLGSFLDEEPFGSSRDPAAFLATMQAAIDRGGRFAVIELTSEALARGFAWVWPSTIGVFTNLTRDHLDLHGSPEHYAASKAQLFVSLDPSGAAVLNGCDAASELMAAVVPSGVRVVRYAVPSRGPITGSPELRATAVKVGWDGTQVTIVALGELAHAPKSLRIRAIGEVYAENALAALATALVAGVPAEEAAAALAEAKVPPGRFEVLEPGPGPQVVVDDAHTPDALARTLATARSLCQGELWVVFGAGGDRDQGKREPMGAAASAADHVVLTSNNPRTESPNLIADQIRSGIDRSTDVRVELDRRRAIRRAVLDAGERDVVVIAGRGHEVEQVIGQQVLPLGDATEARVAMHERSAGRRPPARQRAARRNQPSLARGK
jgi:UDP-N-acetylmuramoyl-L-alanyl-D-glutamate--2,6-diaminopimelate ligase